MSNNKKPQRTNPHNQATNKSVVVELSKDATINLAGYFDVLIQMDFAKQLRNEGINDNDNLQVNTNSTTKNN